MTAKRFIAQLKSELKKSDLTKAEQIKILSDYQEHLSNALEEGENEIDVLATIGQPSEIVEEYTTELGRARYNKKALLTRKILVVLKPFLRLLACIFLLAPVIWLIVFIKKYPVEVGYFFQLIISLCLFSFGCFLLFFTKKLDK